VLFIRPTIKSGWLLIITVGVSDEVKTGRGEDRRSFPIRGLEEDTEDMRRDAALSKCSKVTPTPTLTSEAVTIMVEVSQVSLKTCEHADGNRTFGV